LQQLGSGLQELLTTAANNLLSTVISTVDLSSLSGLLGLLGKRSVEQEKIVEQLQQLGSGLQELLTTAANNLLSTVISTVDLSSLSGLLGLLGKRSIV